MIASYVDRTVCTCDHLTNFAVLMSLKPSVIEESIVIHSFIHTGCSRRCIDKFKSRSDPSITTVVTDIKVNHCSDSL